MTLHNFSDFAIEDSANNRCIICGDINLILDPDLENGYWVGAKKQKSRQKVPEMIKAFDLVKLSANRIQTFDVQLSDELTLNNRRVKFCDK